MIEPAFNEENAIIHYYSMRAGELGKPLEIKSCPGDLYKICDVLYDYENILHRMLDIFPEDKGSGAQMMYEVYAAQIQKIREKIERELGYSVEEAIKKCIIKQSKKVKDDGIGEEAMVLAIRKGREEAKRKEQELLSSKNNERRKNNEL